MDSSYISYKRGDFIAEIFISDFDELNHTIKKCDEFVLEIDSSLAIGCFFEKPRFLIDSIVISDKGEKTVTPKTAYKDLFNPQIGCVGEIHKNYFCFSKCFVSENDFVFLYMYGGTEGVAGYKVIWIFYNGCYQSRVLIGAP